jgi:hypothetical protein
MVGVIKHIEKLNKKAKMVICNLSRCS